MNFKAISLFSIFLMTLNTFSQNTKKENCQNQLETFFISNLGLIVNHTEASNHSFKLLDEIKSQKEFKLKKYYEAQPAKYTAIHSNYNQVKTSAENLISLLEDLKKNYKVNDNQYSYQYMSDTIFSTEKFFLNGDKNKLSELANTLKTSIDTFYTSNKKLFKNLPRDLQNYNKNRFDTSQDFSTREGLKINYFQYYFFNRTNVEVLTTLNLFISYTKQIQFEYLTELVGV